MPISLIYEMVMTNCNNAIIAAHIGINIIAAGCHFDFKLFFFVGLPLYIARLLVK